MQDTYVNTAVCRDEEGRQHTFRYYITTDRIPAGNFLCECYGVRIETTGGDAAELRSITHSRSRLEQLVTALMHGAVSPTELPYVIEDWF